VAADDSNRLGRYLRARRELVTPERAGIPGGMKRRVPGLRREEVAMLAGISADYYLRLERGRDTNPSGQVLAALARVLMLDEVEHQYLLDLAQPQRQTAKRARTEHVPERLHHLLAAVELPAFIEGRTFDVLASNPLAVALSPRLRPGQNRLRSLLLDPEEREFQTDWEAATAGFVGAFRRSIGDEIDDARTIELVGELSLASARFRALWARQDVRPLTGGATTVQHPIVGELRLNRDKLPVDDVVLVIYYADAGSESAEKLSMLASITAPGDTTGARSHPSRHPAPPEPGRQ
jgi:transcriptional regulator with XRE-family HTH domain